MPQKNFNPGIMKYSDIRPLFAGHCQCVPHHYYGPAIRNHCIIHCCLSGKGIFRNDSGTYRISRGQAFIINPEQMTFYQADGEDPWNYSWIAFSGAICEKIAKIKPVITLPDTKMFEQTAKAVDDDILNPEYYLKMLLDLFEILLPVDQNSMPGYALRAKDYIKMHFTDDISVEQIAASFNIDRRYLLRLFKKEFGITIVNYIVKTRLEAAYNYLRAGYPVNRTATMCGYSDAYNFSKMFKKYYGFSPSAALENNHELKMWTADYNNKDVFVSSAEDTNKNPGENQPV